MKKPSRTTTAALFFAAVFSLFSLAGCGSTPVEKPADSLTIVSTIFPSYDWAENILAGSGHTPTLLMKNGVDMHSFQPTAADIISLADADLFIYAGGESDAWVESALKNAQNENMTVINMMNVLSSSLREEELAEGMQGEADNHDHDHDHKDEPAYDEHVWLSIENAETISSAIADALCALDESHADLYRENLSNYLEKLSALSDDYQHTVDTAARKTILFGDRFPFLYLTREYGLDYYAAFPGCSAETEASFATVSFLAGKVDEFSLPYVLTIDGSDGKIAQTIIDNTASRSAGILTLNSMQSVTDEQLQAGENYLSIMEENLEVLKKALND